MPKLTHHQFVNILLLLALLLLSASMWLSYHQVQKLKFSTNWVNHSRIVLENTFKIKIGLLEADANVQNYLSNRDPKILPVFNMNTNEVKKNITIIYQLTADNVRQQENIQKLKELVIKKINLLNNSINTAKNNISNNFVTSLNKTGNDLNISIDELLSNIQENETVLLAIRGSEYQIEDEKSNQILLLTALIGNGLLIMSFILLNYHVTERARAQKAKQKIESNFERIINSSPDLIAAIDTDYHLTAFNKKYEMLIEKLFNKELKLNTSIKYILSTNHSTSFNLACWDRALKGETFIVIHSNQKDGQEETQFFEAIYTPTYDSEGTLIGACHIMRDITERHKIDRMKSEFVSTVSHELRTPLTSIRGSIGLLLGGAVGSLDDKTKNMLSIAYNNCERLINLINDILDIEKIESGNLEFKYQIKNINEVVEEAVLINQTYAIKFHVSLEAHLSHSAILVEVDPNRILQVLTNLISNAVKFSKPNDVVKVKVEKMEETVKVSVIDHGEGVPQAFQHRVFEKFSQADSSDVRRHGGTGLGLSISKAIIQQHQGQINFVSQPKQGSIFYFELPLLSQQLKINKENEFENIIHS